jgi:hypothetical protein
LDPALFYLRLYNPVKAWTNWQKHSYIYVLYPKVLIPVYIYMYTSVLFIYNLQIFGYDTDGKFNGSICCHVDDFLHAGNEQFDAIMDKFRRLNVC